mgnify:CR=1 FL=1
MDFDHLAETRLQDRLGVANFADNRTTEIECIIKRLGNVSVCSEGQGMLIAELVLRFGAHKQSGRNRSLQAFMSIAGEVLDQYVDAETSVASCFEFAKRVFASPEFAGLVGKYERCAEDHLRGRLLEKAA